MIDLFVQFGVGLGLGLLASIPVFMLLREIDLFGKYLRWGRCSLDDAVDIGFRKGYDAAEENFNIMLLQLKKEYLPKAVAEIGKEFQESVQLVMRRDGAIDFETGIVIDETLVYKLPKIGIRLELVPKNEFVSKIEMNLEARRTP